MNLRLVDADAFLVFQNFKILPWIGFLFFRIQKFSVGEDEVVEGWYCVADSHVVLTDADGKANCVTEFSRDKSVVITAAGKASGRTDVRPLGDIKIAKP